MFMLFNFVIVKSLINLRIFFLGPRESSHYGRIFFHYAMFCIGPLFIVLCSLKICIPLIITLSGLLCDMMSDKLPLGEAY